MMSIYATVMTLALAGAISFAWLSADGRGNYKGPFMSAMVVCGGIYLVGLLGVGWVANILAMWRVRK